VVGFGAVLGAGPWALLGAGLLGVPSGSGACRAGAPAPGVAPGLGASDDGWLGSPKGRGACCAGAVGVAARIRSCNALEPPPRGVSERISDRARKIPPHHQLSLVKMVTACRPPSTVSVPPPPNDASPPPWPAWSSTTTDRRRASSTSKLRRNANMLGGKCSRWAFKCLESRVTSRESRSVPQLLPLAWIWYEDWGWGRYHEV
jgi:hypothetical protein